MNHFCLNCPKLVGTTGMSHLTIDPFSSTWSHQLVYGWYSHMDRARARTICHLKWLSNVVKLPGKDKSFWVLYSTLVCKVHSTFISRTQITLTFLMCSTIHAAMALAGVVAHVPPILWLYEETHFFHEPLKSFCSWIRPQYGLNEEEIFY